MQIFAHKVNFVPFVHSASSKVHHSRCRAAAAKVRALLVSGSGPYQTLDFTRVVRPRSLRTRTRRPVRRLVLSLLFRRFALSRAKRSSLTANLVCSCADQRSVVGRVGRRGCRVISELDRRTAAHLCCAGLLFSRGSVLTFFNQVVVRQPVKASAVVAAKQSPKKVSSRFRSLSSIVNPIMLSWLQAAPVDNKPKSSLVNSNVPVNKTSS